MKEIIKKLENKVVYIESQETLKEALKLIEGKGVEHFLILSEFKDLNYLFFSGSDFGLSFINTLDQQITFDEFKTIMK